MRRLVWIGTHPLGNDAASGKRLMARSIRWLLHERKMCPSISRSAHSVTNDMHFMIQRVVLSLKLDLIDLNMSIGRRVDWCVANLKTIHSRLCNLHSSFIS